MILEERRRSQFLYELPSKYLRSPKDMDEDVNRGHSELLSIPYGALSSLLLIVAMILHRP